MKAFQRLGWEIARQRGSHIIMVRDGFSASLSVPNHRPVARGTLRSLIRDAGLSVEEFCVLL
ncbi:MAG: type II toxin-antitoxin system HicA family toxin [Verrucomicrobiota bacterium]